MTWDVIAGLVLQYGLPFAEKVIEKWQNKAEVSLEEWADLKALAANTARSQMLAAFSRAGVDPTSEKAIALLAQLPS